MCDYSLMHFPNRLAKEGEALIVHRFPSGSKGLAGCHELEQSQQPQDKPRSFWLAVKQFFNPVDICPVPAVCIPPGARLQLHDIGEGFQREHKVSCQEEVTFEQLTAMPNTYRDAVCFSNGDRVRLQELAEGQRVTVLSLGGDRAEEPELETAGRARLRA